MDFDPNLYLVTDRPLCAGRDLLDVVAHAVAGGVTMVQLREKHATTREFLELARRLKALLDPMDVPLLINDRLDIALAVDTSGLHVGQGDMPYADARRLLGPDKIIGLTIDSEDELRVAEGLDVDYLGVGPVFPTTTKENPSPVVGLEGLTRARGFSRHRIVAIGAINVDNAAQVMATGVDGVAVVSALCSAQDPRAMARALRREVDMGAALARTR